jgi:hypothetical protein
MIDFGDLLLLGVNTGYLAAWPFHMLIRLGQAYLLAPQIAPPRFH